MDHDLAQSSDSMESSDEEVDSEEIISIPPLSTKEQEEVLQTCSIDIEGMLDLEQIFSHLYHQNLLSDTECEILQTSNIELSRKKKIARFITNLPRKGSNALDRFVKCLVNSADGTGHRELAQIIGSAVEERSQLSLSNEESEQSASKPLRKIRCHEILIAVIAISLVCSVVYIYWSTITYNFNLVHSKSLPYPPENFVGREKEMKELSKLLDFGNKDIRIVNIYGSPGFGKSTLAKHVGHKMVKEGVTVHYVNMDDLPDKDIKTALAEKILEAAHIVSRNVTFERLVRWARECSSKTLVILDNCDDAIHIKKEKFQHTVVKVVEESLYIKVILTSRKVAAFLVHFEYYKLEQLSTTASCQLLEHKIPSRISLSPEEKGEIANLTGNVPLALQIIGSILHLPDSPSPTVLIDELKSELIKTLSPEDFPAYEQVFTTINISYKYLPKELQKIGRQLTVFPGSFELPAAFAVHVCNSSTEPTKEFGNQLTSLVRNSLLEHSQRTNRYQYHRLIKEYFLLVQRRDWPNEASKYLPAFHVYYATKLMSESDSFKYHYEQSLAFLDSEQHNLEHLFENLKDMQSTSNKKLDIEEFVVTVMALSSAVDANFLQVRFSREKCCLLLNSTLNKLDKMMPHLQYYLHGQSFEVESVFDSYLLIIKQVATCEENQHGTWEAMLVYSVRTTIIESKSDIIASLKYINFYNELRSFYLQLGERFEVNVLECHRLIIKRTDTHLATCQPLQCKYYDIGMVYYAMGQHQEASDFFEKEVKRNVDIMSQVRTLVMLVYIYSHMEEYDKMISTTARLQNLYSGVAAVPPDKLVYDSDAMLMFIQFYRAGELFDEAHSLENRFFNGLLNLKDKAKTAFHIKQTAQDQTSLLDTAYNALYDLFEAGNFTETIKLANFFIKLIGNSDSLTFDSHKIKLHLLVGKAKFHMGQYSDGMDHIELALLRIGNKSIDYEDERRTACWYLISRITYLDTCYWIKWNVMMATVVPVAVTVVVGMYLIFSPFPFTIVLFRKEWNKKTEKPIITLLQLSHSTNLATTSGHLSILDNTFSVIQSQLQEIVSEIKSTLKLIVKSLLSFLNFIKLLVDFLNDFLWILLVWGKLVLVYKVYRFLRKPGCLNLKVVKYYLLDFVFFFIVIALVIFVLVVSRSFSLTKVWLRGVLDPRFKYGEDKTPHSKFIDSLTDDLFSKFSRL